MKKKILIGIIAVIVIASLIFGITMFYRKDDSSGIKVIKVSEVTRSVFYAPQYVAINNGYFEENGIRFVSHEYFRHYYAGMGNFAVDYIIEIEYITDASLFLP